MVTHCRQSFCLRLTKDFDVINPSTEEVCAIISLGSPEDTDLAVKSAKSSHETNLRNRQGFLV